MSHSDLAETDPTALASHADPTETARTALASYTHPANTASTSLASCIDPTETASAAQEPSSHISVGIPQNDIPSQMQLDDVRAQSRNERIDEDIKVAKTMLRRLEEGKITVEEVCSAEVVQRISGKLKHVHNSLKNQRTAVLWTAYMEMVDILRRFIKAERTGNWSLHPQSVYDMLPYFAAAGHRLYAKSAYIYLQMMNELQKIHPHIYKNFQNGLHCARRSDRFWAGLSTDLMIEQVLMRSVKTSGGLTRGKGFSETQRLVWLMSIPACAEVNDAMQTLTGVRYSHVLQHCYICIYVTTIRTNQSDDILTYLITAMKQVNSIRKPQKQESCGITMTPLI